MSLINDLVLEVDRRRSSSDSGEKESLQSLQPVRREQGSGHWSDYLLPVMATVAVVSVATAAFLLHGLDRIGESGRILSTPLERSVDRPAVGAGFRPEEVDAKSKMTGSLLDSSSTSRSFAQAPNLIRRVSTEPTVSGTRIRIEADHVVPYEIRGAGIDREIEFILESSRLDEPIGPLELRRTPIRSFQARNVGTALHLHFTLDKTARVQGQWIDRNGRPALLVDIEGKSIGLEARDANALAQPRTPTTRDGSRELAIAPSSADEARRRQERHQQAAAQILREARIAVAEGHLDRASELYEEALVADPKNRQARFEHAEIQLDRGLHDRALGKIREARRDDPVEPSWAILHARALAEAEDLDGAIAVLDGISAHIRESPEVHAVAAAYTQRAGDHAGAVDRYEILVRHFPSRASLWMGMGISLEALERSFEASDVYRIALEVGGLPSSSRAWVKGRVAALQGEG